MGHLALSIRLRLMALLYAGSFLLTVAWGGALQAQSRGSIQLRADVQEADATAGIVTARGNVRIAYPEQQIYATSAQAQYYSRERRIILSGNVYVQQEANTLRAEVVTYLIDENRFVATPRDNEQVESVYILPEPEEEPAAAPEPAPLPGLPTPGLPSNLPNFDVPADE